MPLTVFDLGLFGQIVGGIDRRHHSLDRQKGGQVGSVAGDDDQCEEPPDAADNTATVRSRADVYSLLRLRGGALAEKRILFGPKTFQRKVR